MDTLPRARRIMESYDECLKFRSVEGAFLVPNAPETLKLPVCRCSKFLFVKDDCNNGGRLVGTIVNAAGRNTGKLGKNKFRHGGYMNVVRAYIFKHSTWGFNFFSWLMRHGVPRQRKKQSHP